MRADWEEGRECHVSSMSDEWLDELDELMMLR